MIVWFNCKITNIRRNPTPARDVTTVIDRMDITKYALKSFSVLQPLITKFIFNFELGEDQKGKESQLENYIREIFSADKIQDIFLKEEIIFTNGKNCSKK